MRALEAGLACCEVCHQILRIPAPKTGDRAALCPRCRSVVHARKPESIQRTWALTLAGIIFYIPANLLPMMHVQTIAGTQSDTIMSGVIYFMETGSYLIGSVIFIASILVPVLKILILITLLLSVQRRFPHLRRRRQKLYQLTEIVGRWSMVDIYVVSIMVALVQFGALSRIQAGLGAVFFLLVVVVTMLAAMSFDPRLIWDRSPKESHV
ncbi:paraquat-inducible protein A [Nitratifractor sp.]